MLRATLPSLSDLLAEQARRVRQVGAALTQEPSVRRAGDLRDYLASRFGARLPDGACCAGHVSPWRFFCAAYFAEHSVIVLKGSRGLAGKTWTLGLLALAEAALLRADVALLGGSGAQSARVHKAMDRFWTYPNSPRDLVEGEPGVTKTLFKAGNEVVALTASQKSVRGPHPQRLRLDEVDEMDVRIFNAAMGQTLSDRGVPAQTVIASTHQNPDGTFSAVLEMAAEKGWPVMEWCYRETLEENGGWLSMAEVERKRSEMTADMWRTEVELQEPSAEGRAIDVEAVERMFVRELGETEGDVGRVEQFEGPRPGATYAHGADWGKKRDLCAVPTLRTDCRPMRFVALYRDRRKPYHVMTPRLSERLEEYGGHGVHDAHGVGDVIDETLEVPGGATLEGYTQWQGAARIALFSEYISAIERGDVECPMSEPWYRAHRYVTNEDLYGSGHPPDEFIGCALAYRASKGPAAPKTKKRVVRSYVWGTGA